MKKNHFVRSGIIAAGIPLALGLFGCSDSSSQASQQPATPPPLPIGNLIGLAPEGLQYSTATQQGLTGAGGSFEYRNGETITFSLSGTPLGSAEAQAELDLFDLVGLSSPPVGAAAISKATITPDRTGGVQAAQRIAQLLFAFDDDADASNGVQISSAIRTRLESIDFRVTGVSDEYLMEDMKRTVRASVAAGEMSVRVIPTLDEAMQRLYDGLGIETGLVSAGRTVTDGDADGTPDSAEIYRFDATGLPIEYQTDDTGSGTIRFRQLIQYFSPSRRSVSESDMNNDGIDQIRTYSYDDFGELVLEEIDNDGQPGLDEIVTIRYDENGALVFRERLNVAAGTSLIQQFNTDAAGNRTEYLIDNEGDGIFDRRDTFVYNEFRDWTRREIDDNNDGIVDQILTRAFNSRGIQTLATEDRDADGVPNRTTEFVIDADNRVSRAIYDLDGDSTIEFTVDYTYNTNGRQVRAVTDRTGLNRPTVTINTEFDGSGNRTRVSTDSTGDGQPNDITTYDFDADGFPTSEVRDRDADGVADSRTDFSVNLDGVITERRIDREADGVVDVVVQFLELSPVHPAWLGEDD
ncbi:MAG: hypothetical protein AAGI27_06040 [Pseudomonadota bacterium]